ncbi:TPA: hypothetical protein DIV49_02915 [Candidatus Saccharibacteria bacterium]|nr:hypothetical protein [Candidatus Saccharibacteria bacterium]HRJ91137.1 hypothetical protein [Candidatus Saccharibacteria bacterium]
MKKPFYVGRALVVGHFSTDIKPITDAINKTWPLAEVTTAYRIEHFQAYIQATRPDVILATRSLRFALEPAALPYVMPWVYAHRHGIPYVSLTKPGRAFAVVSPATAVDRLSRLLTKHNELNSSMFS